MLIACFAALGFASDDEKFSAAAEKAAEAKSAQVRAENQTLNGHDWSGEYYAGDGMGVNQSLILSPKTGYVFEWHGCLGLYDRNLGAIEEKDGLIRLTFTYENSRKGFQGVAPEMRVVRWGERRYLVPTDGIIDFCNDINAGREARLSARGSHLIRRGDEERDVTGYPDVPDQLRDYLLKVPINAKLVAIGKPTTRPSIIIESHFIDTPVTLDVGRVEGVRLGMELYFMHQDLVQSVTVTDVEEHQSTALMTSMTDHVDVVKIGYALCTRPRWALIKYTP